MSNGKDGTVMAIDPATINRKQVGRIPVGKRPWNMAITPDGSKLYVANGRSDSVSVIDTENWSRSRTSRLAASRGAW